MIRQLFPTLTAIMLSLTPVLQSDGVLHAQQDSGLRPPARVPVTVVLVDRMEDYGGAPAVILRRSDVAPRDVILLRADAATGKQLSEAVLDLLAIRQQIGDLPSTTAAVRVRPKAGAPGRTRRELPWAQRVVNDMRKAELQAVAGIGTVRAVQIWLPPQRKRP